MDPMTAPPTAGDREASDLPDLGTAHDFVGHIVDAITNPLFVKDEAHCLVLVNDAFCGILGRAREQIIGRTDFDFVPPEEARVFQAKDRIVFETGAPDENEEPLTDAAGKQHWIVTRKSLIRTDDGKKYIVGVITDITERKQMELELRKANVSLKEAMDKLSHTERLATIGQVAATVSHELRNPLGAIRNSMALIHQLTAGKQLGLDRALERTERNIERCATIINALLEFTHKKEITRTPTVVRQWLTAVLDEYRLPGGVTLERDLRSDDMAAIDHERFGHVVVNLVDNAVQALRDPAWQRPQDHALRVTLRLDSAGPDLQLSVIDTGPGIRPEVLPRIFEPLFTTKNFGVGLGLPTVRQIVELHGGSIHIDSAPGAGTTVTIRLPRSDATKAASGAAAA